MRAEYKDRIKFVLVPYMRTYSDTSRDAAIASFAAWDQGKFWEMHDLLFENAPNLERDVVDGLAQKLGLDMGLFKKSMDSMEHLNDLQGNLDRIHELDIWSTPTVIINGSVVKGAQPYENYRDLIEKALNSSSQGWDLHSLASSFLGFLEPSKAYGDEGTFGMGEVPRWVKAPILKPTNQLHVGDQAPDFTLPGTQDREVALSDYRGKKNVLLTFMPAAFTPV